MDSDEIAKLHTKLAVTCETLVHILESSLCLPESAWLDAFTSKEIRAEIHRADDSFRRSLYIYLAAKYAIQYVN
jgi:hypothetical protein